MISEINATELKTKLDNKEDFVFLDCRETSEWDEAHVKEATLLPLSEFETKYQNLLTDKNKEVVIMCRSGRRSMNVCLFLNEQGYENLVNVEGGILGWIEEGFSIVQG